MQLAVLSAVLLALAASESGGGPVAGVAWRLMLIGSAVLVAPLVALAGTQRLAATSVADDDREDAAARLEAVVVGIWLAMVAVILILAQWPQIVRANWQLARWPLIDELAVLTPVIGSLVLVWTAVYRLQRAAQLAACQVRQMQPPPASLLAHLWLQSRHHLGLVVLPPLVIVGLLETLGRSQIDAAGLDAAWWLAVPLLVTMLLLMPAVVRRIWRTTPLAHGELREAIDRVCQGRHCFVSDIRIWQTGGTMANAAVVGLSRYLRSMLLTDVLIRRLSIEEVAAVVRHELAHLRRWHLPLRLALMLLPLLLWLAVKELSPDIEPVAKSLFSSMGFAGSYLAALVLPFSMLAYAIIVVGWYSRLLEHDADLDACLNDAGSFEPDAARHFVSALSVLTGRCRESRFSHWMHPALGDRLRFIDRVATEPGFRASFRQRLSCVAAGMLALYVAALAVIVLR